MKPVVGIALFTVGFFMFMASIGAHLLVLARVKQAGLIVSLLPISTHDDRVLKQYQKLVHSGSAPRWPIIVWRKLGIAALFAFLFGALVMMV